MNRDISKILSPIDLDNLSINTIRFLSIDAIQKANSGHPGLPMGAAAFAYVLWTRFLHSTGQFHKGGPTTGLFLQLTADDVEDVPIPGAPYTFGIFKRAEAQGDLEALKKHGRWVGRIYLGADVDAGLIVLKEDLKLALPAEQVMP